MTKPWKLLGPLEALCGVLMLGMTAAALMAILQHMIKMLRQGAE
jgi:galactitol-specific phosphotransferase system IIC component